MRQATFINLFLFLTLGCVLAGAFLWDINPQHPWRIIFHNLGVSMIGGAACSFLLFGRNLTLRHRESTNRHFPVFGRNQDIGQEYWMDLLKDIDKSTSSASVWFVGSRHHTWIDQGLAYREVVKRKLIDRVNRATKCESGFETLIIVSDETSAKDWKSFVEDEILSVTRYHEKRPDLIRIGVIDERLIRYSIVAHSGSLVITTYTFLSKGRSANSPTFEVCSGSEVANLYLEDLRKIRESVPDNGWLQLDIPA